MQSDRANCTIQKNKCGNLGLQEHPKVRRLFFSAFGRGREKHSFNKQVKILYSVYDLARLPYFWSTQGPTVSPSLHPTWHDEAHEIPQSGCQVAVCTGLD